MSTTDGNDLPVVDPNTDNLEDFKLLMAGKAKIADPEPEEPIEEEVPDVDADPDAETDEPEDEVDGEEPEAEDEGDTEDEDEEEAPEEEAKPKSKNRKSAKERISELTTQRNTAADRAIAAEQRAAAIEARMAELEARLSKSANPEPEPEVAEFDPNFPDFDAVDANGDPVYPLGQFDPRYNAAVVQYTVQKQLDAARKADQEQAAEQAQQAEDAALIGAWNEKLASTEETLPDLREELATLDPLMREVEPEHGVFLAKTVMQLNRGPEVLYALAQNPSEAARIIALPPVAAAIALGELHGRLPSKSKAEAPSEKKVSKAKEPAPTSRGTSASKQIPPDTDNLADFKKLFYQ